MTITGIDINARDLEASVRFYTEVLDASVSERTNDHAALDVPGGRIHIERVAPSAPDSDWRPDDLQRGFRHVGLKVASVDEVFSRAQTLGAPVHLEPLEAAGGVRIAFFFDPDGVLVEVVERHLTYDEVRDQGAVDAERALPTPDRPRLDHVAVSVADADATMARWATHGGRCAGNLLVSNPERDLHIHYVHDGGIVLELFSFDVDTTPAPRLDGQAGFAAVRVDHGSPSGAPWTDEDGLRLVGTPRQSR